MDAAGQLRQTESSSLARGERIRWSLYLGLSELSLGNLERALPHLCAARNELPNDPDALSPAERGQLEAAWRAIGRMPAEPLTRHHPCGP